MQVSRKLWITVYISFLCTFLQYPVNAAEIETVQITLEEDSSEAKLQDIKFLATGGFTPTFNPSKKVFLKLQESGARRARLINVEWGNRIKVTRDRELSIKWSKELENGLRLCKRYGWKPHIIIGHSPPVGLVESDKDRKITKPIDWDLYDKYIQTFLDHVTGHWGFKETEWEVGIEFDSAHTNWLVKGGMRRNLHPTGFNAYVEHYEKISVTFSAYKSKYPELHILLGGPALTQNSMRFPPGSKFNWITQFIEEVGRRKLLCDFISMHYFGNAGSGSDFVQRITWMNATIKRHGQSIPIWITEWGPSALNDKYASTLNNSRIAGAYALDFLDTMAHAGIGDAIFLLAAANPKNSWPALHDLNQNPTHSFKAIQSILEIHGTRQKCTTTKEIGCIAVTTRDRIKILLWRLDWGSSKMGASTVKKLKTSSRSLVALDIQGVKTQRPLIINKYLQNGVVIEKTKMPVIKSAKKIHPTNSQPGLET